MIHVNASVKIIRTCKKDYSWNIFVRIANI